MSEQFQFRAIIQNAGGGGAYVIVPVDVEKVFGKKRVKIKATIEGEPYRGTLVRMGGPDHMLLILKDIREKIGKSFGDEIFVELEEDLEQRKVEIPPDLLKALKADPQALAIFERLSYTHQKEYVSWVEQAKRPETRLERIRRTIEMLTQGKREH